ncbi:hypothetical protein [Nonomuraea sp. NPDC046570]|uniref:hypothetical protein n=1 Tax=Nonomuraea sp. NPDC046570 TaxID=3155255 RepID=UPI00340C1091
MITTHDHAQPGHRRRLSILLIPGTATASAYPVKGAPELTHNALYKTAKVPAAKCELTKGTSKASTTKYLTKVVGCLNASWSKTVKDFVPARVDIKSKHENGPCGTGMDIAGSFATSCRETIQIQLAADWIKAKDDLAILVEVTRAYSGLIQGQTGISEAWWAMPNDADEAQLDEQTHRFYLQADCLGAVSMKSLGRTSKNWKPALTAETPGEYSRFKWHGKPANRLHWFTQGYKAGRPGACNTWKAPSSKVA